jgi:hypothetical protein
MFRDELARVIALLQDTPELGIRVRGREIRRILLPDALGPRDLLRHRWTEFARRTPQRDDFDPLRAGPHPIEEELFRLEPAQPR